MKALSLIALTFILSACAHKKHHDHHAEKKDHDCNCSKAAQAVKPVSMEFDGTCPMGLCRRNKKVACDPEITMAHKGKNYCFSSLEARETFMKDVEGNLDTATKRWKVMQAAGSR